MLVCVLEYLFPKGGVCRKDFLPTFSEIWSNDCFMGLILIPSMIMSWEVIVQMSRENLVIQGIQRFQFKDIGFYTNRQTFIRLKNCGEKDPKNPNTYIQRIVLYPLVLLLLLGTSLL